MSTSYCRFKAGRKSGWVSSFLAALDDGSGHVGERGKGCESLAGRVIRRGPRYRECDANRVNWKKKIVFYAYDGPLEQRSYTHGQGTEEDGFHWENVKLLTVRLALIHDTGTAIQKPPCAKTTKIRIIRSFRRI